MPCSFSFDARTEGRPQIAYLKAVHRMGLSVRDLLVLHALGSVAIEAKTLTVSTPAHELAQICEISVEAVQRALVVLRDKGFIVRHQEVRRAGCPALTLLLPPCWALIGVGQHQAPIPGHIAQHLIMSTGELIEGVYRAVHEAVPLDEEPHDGFGGTPDEWGYIVTAARGVMAANGEETATRLVEQADADRVIEIRTPCGATHRFDAEHFQQLAPGPVDAAFLREVLQPVVDRRGAAPADVPKLLAEAAYSRAVGFVRGHEWERGTRVLAKTMSEPRWSRPFKIRDDWYRAAASSLLVGSSSAQADPAASRAVH